jgi:hypothetical protein
MKNAIILRWSRVGERFTAEEKNQALKRHFKTKFNHNKETALLLQVPSEPVRRQ